MSPYEKFMSASNGMDLSYEWIRRSKYAIIAICALITVIVIVATVGGMLEAQ